MYYEIAMEILDQHDNGCIGLSEDNKKWIVVYPHPTEVKSSWIYTKNAWMCGYTDEGWNWLKEVSDSIKEFDHAEFMRKEDLKEIHDFDTYSKYMTKEGDVVECMLIDPIDLMRGMEGLEIYKRSKVSRIPFYKIVRTSKVNKE